MAEDTSSATPRDLEEVEGASSVSPASKKKRRLELVKPKNLQACDRCRRKKTKCEPVDAGRRDVCQACHTASMRCTFEMPLTASRTKRVQRGLSLGGSLSSSTSASNTAGPSNSRIDTNVSVSVETGSGSRIRSIIGSESDHHDDHQIEYDRHQSLGRGIHSQQAEVESEDEESCQSPVPERQSSSTSVSVSGKMRTTSVRREGPTSLSFILHSTPTLPISFLTEWDRNSGQSMYATSPNSGDGFILVASETDPSSVSNTPPSSVLDVLHSDSWTEVVSRLVETFLVNVSPLIPVVVREDMGEAGRTLIHAMAAVAAARRNCPHQIFETLRYILRREMLEQDTLSDPTRQNVQILLVACLVDELSLQSGGAQPAHVARTRLSSAIRMAQDLSMDRPMGPLAQADRRIWQCAMVLDQWNAARNGVRPILSIGADGIITSESDDFFSQLVSISTILGRVLSEVYGAEGIKNASNKILNGIRDSIDKWKESLPSKLRFNGLWSSLPAGILNMLYTSVKFLLHRPFMRWSFIVPTHIELDMNINVWVDLLTCSRGSIEWAANQEELADLLFFGPYALALSGLIQYHTWARRKEWDGVVQLDKARRDAVDRWISRSPESHLPLQKAQLRIISLLCTATRLPRPETTSFSVGTRGLNPTPGSLNRLPETSIRGVTFLRDPSHPRGGVLVATQQAAREIKDLPAGTVIIGGAPVDDVDVSTGPSTAPESNKNGSGSGMVGMTKGGGGGSNGLGLMSALPSAMGRVEGSSMGRDMADTVGVNVGVVGVAVGNGVIVGPGLTSNGSVNNNNSGGGNVMDVRHDDGTDEAAVDNVDNSTINGITPTTQGYLNALLAGEGIDTRTTLSAAEWDTMASYILPGFEGMGADSTL